MVQHTNILNIKQVWYFCRKHQMHDKADREIKREWSRRREVFCVMACILQIVYNNLNTFLCRQHTKGGQTSWIMQLMPLG